MSLETLSIPHFKTLNDLGAFQAPCHIFQVWIDLAKLFPFRNL